MSAVEKYVYPTGDMKGNEGFGAYSLEDLHALFKVVSKWTLNSGGDGWATIVSPNFDKLAELFGEWAEQTKEWGTERTQNGDHISFGYEYGQEFVSFARKREKVEMDDIVVEIM